MSSPIRSLGAKFSALGACTLGACLSTPPAGSDTEQGTEGGTDATSTSTSGSTAGTTDSGSTGSTTASTTGTSAGTSDGASTGTDTGSSTGDVEVPVGAEAVSRLTTAANISVFDIGAHPDGGVVVVGTENPADDPPTNTDRGALIYHVDDSGALTWQIRLAGADAATQFFGVVVRDDDILALGETRVVYPGPTRNGQIIIARFSHAGGYQGTVLLGDTSEEHAWAGALGPNGEVAVVGQTDAPGFGGIDGFVVMLDGDLNPQWGRGIGTDANDRLRHVSIESDGSILVAGQLGQNGGNSRAWLARLDSTGELTESMDFGGGNLDELYAATSLGDGRYAAVGRTGTWGAGNFDGLLLLVDADPSNVEASLWTLGGPSLDNLGDLTFDGSGNLVATGTWDPGAGMQSDVIQLGVDLEGNEPSVLWSVRHGLERWDVVTGHTAALRADGGLAVGVQSDRGDVTYDPVVLLTNDLGGLDLDCVTPHDDVPGFVSSGSNTEPPTSVNDDAFSAPRTDVTANDEVLEAIEASLTDGAACSP